MPRTPGPRPIARSHESLRALAGLLYGGGLSLVLWAPAVAAAQDTNILHPIPYIEGRLSAPDLDVLGMERARPIPEDRSRRVVLAGRDGEPDMEAHWKPVARPGQGFNNEPRYELAAYRFQKLFLEERDYVVPPVVLRALPLEEYRRFGSAPDATIPGTGSRLFLLSYWVQNLTVDTVDPFSEGLFTWNVAYRWHFANVNVLTHLIDHKDGNHGNVLISMDGLNPRAFSVDNDVAFGSEVSDRGDRWRRLLVNQLPDATVERLRGLTLDQLRGELGVVAEFEIVDGDLRPVDPGPNLRSGRGLRVTRDRVQFGLTDREIRDVHRRIERLLQQVDRGRISVFSRDAVAGTSD
jgi:hypothetical protein